ncbi:MAG TPA: hypothetical protein VGD65_03195, partial [Chryseosolibacter sp.]
MQYSPLKESKLIPVLVLAVLLSLIIWTCTPQQKATESSSTPSQKLSDDSLLTLTQYKTFQYFWDGAEPTSGGARERYHSDNVYPENDK